MASLDQILSAPSSSSEIHILTLVILIVSVLSALGAGWIILSFSVSLEPDAMDLNVLTELVIRTLEIVSA